MEFLHKHIVKNHARFGRGEIHKEAVPYMRKRYESEPLINRPLPPIEMEGKVGEYTTVREVIEKHGPKPSVSSIGFTAVGAFPAVSMPFNSRAGPGTQPNRRFSNSSNTFNNRHSNPSNRDQTLSGQRRGFNEFSRDNNNSNAGVKTNYNNNRNSRHNNTEYAGPKPEDNNSRPLRSYMDIDAPKVRHLH